MLEATMCSKTLQRTQVSEIGLYLEGSDSPPFLKIGETFASFQMSGSFPVHVSKDLWEISCRIGAHSLCKVCRTMGLNLSGPAALCGFKPTCYKQLVNAFSNYAYIRHFGVGTGMEW